MSKPTARPRRPHFSSGPCAKRPGWTPSALADAPVGRSHRSKPGKAKIARAIEQTRTILGVPNDYRIAVVPASDTGAYEMAMWSMLGARPVEMLAWESFGQGWVTDAAKQLKLDQCEIKTADYGEIVDLDGVKTAEHDVCFTWNGTTSGVKVPHGDWIDHNRAGLTLCDATSAVFAMAMPWEKIDVATFSWQKVMGGEAAHGMLILSPRAVQRLESYTPPWPLPKIFRMTKGGKLNESLFEGATINTPSLLCVEDYLDALDWGEKVGGLSGLIKRSERNLSVLEDWVAGTDWIDFLPADKSIRSNTSVCLKITDDWFTSLDGETQSKVPKQIDALLQDEGVAYDINGYRDAPPGLRIWCGATVDAEDVDALTAWLDWAYHSIKAQQAAA